MSVSKKKYSKAKIHITEENKMFTTVDGRVLDEKEMKELRAYHEHEKEQKEFESKFGNQIKKRGGRPKGQWGKAHRRYCAIGEMFEARKRLSRELNRAIAGYIFTDLEKNPKEHLGEKKNPYSTAESVYDIIKRRKWEKRPIG
jgi:hypothetical protein